MLSSYTRHGASRAGDDYQDLWGAQILVEFLEHPDRYEWVRFEAGEFGTLDDIVARRTDGKYVVRQIKFTVDPENEEYEVTWKWLLDRPLGKRQQGTSLLMKWATSLAPLIEGGHVFEAALITNRKPSAEIASAMNGDRIDFDALIDPDLRDKIIAQLGNEATARAFFGEFRFKVDRPEPEMLDESLQSRFFALHGDTRGWLNLMSEIRVWAKHKDCPPHWYDHHPSPEARSALAPTPGITAEVRNPAGLCRALQGISRELPGSCPKSPPGVHRPIWQPRHREEHVPQLSR